MLQAGHHDKRACDASAYSSALTMDLHYDPSARMTNQQQPRRIRKERVGQQICELAGVGMDRRQRVVRPADEADRGRDGRGDIGVAFRGSEEKFFRSSWGRTVATPPSAPRATTPHDDRNRGLETVGLRDRHDLFVPTVKPIRPCPTIDWIRPRKQDQVAMPGANGKPPMTAPTTARQAASSFEPASIRASRSRTCQ
jgi:hypothetical protein